MPYKDGKSWAGQVKKAMKGEEYQALLALPGWTRLKNGAIQYKKKVRNFKTKTAAAAWERDHWQEIQDSQISPLFQTLTTFSQASSEYLSAVDRRSTAEKKGTYNYKRKLVKDILAFWREDKPLPIETLDIERFLDHEFESQGGAKANRSKRELNTLFQWMKDRHMIDVVPTTPIEEYRQEDFKKYVPPAKDIRAITQAANAFQKDIIRTAYHTLARAGELRRLKKEHIDFVNRKLTLFTRKRRGGKLEPGKVDINDTLLEILKRRAATVKDDYIFPSVNGGQLPKSTMDKILPRLFEKINKKRVENNQKKIMPFTMHSIRHHVAAHLFLDCQYSVAELQKILRHKRASTTDEYLKSIIDMDTTRGLSALDFDNFEIEKMADESNVIAYPGTL